jgi:hypothetical protein
MIINYNIIGIKTIIQNNIENEVNSYISENLARSGCI